MEKLQVRLILEILGRPPEHVKETLSSVVDKLGTEQGINVLDKTFHDPVPTKDSKSLYSAFAEVSLELDNLINYFALLLVYMPAHIEVISPEKLVITNHDFNEIGNRLVERLHDYDAITQRTVYERDFLAGKLKEVAPVVFDQLFPKPTVEDANSVKKPVKKSKKKAVKKATKS